MPVFLLRWGLWFGLFLSLLWCTVVTLSSLTAVLSSSSSKMQWHKLPSTAQNAVLHPCCLYPSTPQTNKQFTCFWVEGWADLKCLMVAAFHSASGSCILNDNAAWMETCWTMQLTLLFKTDYCAVKVMDSEIKQLYLSIHTCVEVFASVYYLFQVCFFLLKTCEVVPKRNSLLQQNQSCLTSNHMLAHRKI